MQEDIRPQADLDGFPADGMIYCESGEELKKLCKQPSKLTQLIFLVKMKNKRKAFQLKKPQEEF